MSQIPKSQPTAKSPALFPELLMRVIPLRLRQPKAARQESTITGLTRISFCASSIGSSDVALQSSIGKVSHGHLAPAPGTEFAIDSNKTLGSRALDYTNVFGNALAPFVEAIPVVGTPLKAVIGGLLGILTIVDVSTMRLGWGPIHDGTQKISQNQQAIKTLTSKLRWLLNEIGTLPEASSSRTLQLQQNMILYLLALYH